MTNDGCRACACPDWAAQFHAGERYCPVWGRPAAVCYGCYGCRYCQLRRDGLLQLREVPE